MSAFIVSDLHAFTLASFAAGRIAEDSAYIDRDTFAQDLANRLKRANVESVNHRYSEKTPRTKCKPQTVTITDAPSLYGLFRCWNYQTCEDSQSIDFHALSALLEAQFTPEEKEAAKGLNLWAI